MEEPLRYDKGKIGKLISLGSDHFVYNYGSSEVIKFSTLGFVLGNRFRKKLQQDYSTCKRIFGKYVLPVEFKFSVDGKWMGAIETKIVGRYLYKQDLKDGFIAEQFRDIMADYRTLLREGNPQVDLVGRDGIFRNCMSNILVTPDRRLCIIDATLMEYRGMGILDPLAFLICKLGNWRNDSVIKYFSTV